MPDLDEISRVLGRIESSVEETKEQVSALFSKHDKVNEEVIEHRGAMKLLASTLVELKTSHETMKPVVEELKEAKSFSKGALFGLSLTSGGLGAGLATMLSRLTNNGLPGH